MAYQNPSPPAPPSVPQASRWRRAISGGFNIIQHNPKRPQDAPPGKADAEKAKTAHARRREQVRRAQRNHRERKEQYIKSLENEVLNLRDREATSERERQCFEDEIEMLKGLLRQHHIAIPHLSHYDDPFARVNVVEQPGGIQRLRVTMPEPIQQPMPYISSPSQTTSSDAPPIDVLLRDTEEEPISIEASSISPYANDLRPLPPLPQAPPPLPGPKAAHPDGLDSHQIGIDFVLSLEQPCLAHTFPTPAHNHNHHPHHPSHSSTSHSSPSSLLASSPSPTFHALTAQAPLLSSAPFLPLAPSSSWTVPAIEIERLLDLSNSLNLTTGELTPVQAWGRLVRMECFGKLGIREINEIRDGLAGKVRCYGFGAVVAEEEFEGVVVRVVGEEVC